ncbi:MAG: hypothetical protein H7222_14235 [Methylotenera sp.]|nr:hypothetical protein [Oligoflexia bacterium]
MKNKKAAKKANAKPMYLRYEFSDEKGTPEGGDIFEFESRNDVQKMISEIIGVAMADGVSVSIAVGEKSTFYPFLGHMGISQSAAEQEMVTAEVEVTPAPAQKKSKKSKTAPKAAKKAKSKKKKK